MKNKPLLFTIIVLIAVAIIISYYVYLSINFQDEASTITLMVLIFVLIIGLIIWIASKFFPDSRFIQSLKKFIKLLLESMQ